MKFSGKLTASLVLLITLGSSLPLSYAAIASAIDNESNKSRKLTQGNREIVVRVSRLLRENYTDPQKGRAASAALLSAWRSGRLASLSRSDLIRIINAILQVSLNDQHLLLREDGLLPVNVERPQRPEPIPTVERLRGDIGYLEITAFPRPDTFAPVVAKAMGALKGARALIIDLRRNGGGSGSSEALTASFLFPNGAKARLSGVIHRLPGTDQFSAESSVTIDVEPTFDCPVFVLVSANTFSAGEALAYDLQALGRAVVIGERTKGAANPGRPYPVISGVSIIIPNGRAFNPVTGGNWEHVGVHPDISAPADDAFAVAYRRAVGALPDALVPLDPSDSRSGSQFDVQGIGSGRP